jgi:myo-inositol 2-dehydrogenase/D-chiro-inositol 1-dehydrogenase
VDPAIAEAGDVDTARILLRTGSGRICMIGNTRRSGYGYDQRIEAYGETGMIAADNPPVSTLTQWRAQGPLEPAIHLAFPSRYAAAYRNEMDHFADILEGRSAPETGYDASLRALTLAEAADRSARSGELIRLEDL